MKSWKLMMLCSAVSLTACQGTGEPGGSPQWSDIQGKPEGFQDDTDNVRSDEEVRTLARDEATQVVNGSVASHITAEQVTAWDAQAAAGDHRTAGYLTAESDPAFASSAASGIAAADLANWNTAFAWGNHAGAGYLKAESDPAFASSAAATLSPLDLANWSTAFAWGNHAGAGYLKAESDPAFTASTAASIASADVTNWNAAFGWGDHASAGYLTTESDPTFTASAASGIASTDVTNWNTAFAWGNHADAGYLTTETDPTFVVSAASTISNVDLANWNTAFAWGNHAGAGYLTTESDPAFTASAASTISTEDVTHWDDAYAWGNHASAGYLESEVDPKVGTLTQGSIPVWNGTALSDGTLREVGGKVGVGTSTPSSLLTVSTLAKFGTTFTSSTTRSCSIGGFNWTNSPPSDSACTAYCTSRGFTGGRVVPTGSKFCGGASCSYISDFETCTVATMQNNGNCNSCASAFACTCLEQGTELNGAVRMMNGNVGIGVETPRSALQVSGYIQLDTTTSAPPAEDCDSAPELGRMLVEPTTGSLWVCVTSGWLAK